MGDAVVEPGTFLQEWLNEYGRPKRIPKKEENFLTYNSGPVGIVKSSSSKTTRKRDELSQTALDLLGNSLTGMPRTVQVTQRADEPIVKFETTRSNANSYRKENSPTDGARTATSVARLRFCSPQLSSALGSQSARLAQRLAKFSGTPPQSLNSCGCSPFPFLADREASRPSFPCVHLF